MQRVSLDGETVVVMKNQYVGDINDYAKYAVLRGLARDPVPLVVCWMLTAPEPNGGGRLTSYLDEADDYRGFDPPLFDGLRELVKGGSRTVNAVQATGLLNGARFHSPLLKDDAQERRRYFTELWRNAAPGALVFFDPDNGLEVPSVPKGRRNSAKYLYWDELEGTYRRGHSVVIYQHFPRVQRLPYLDVLVERAGRLTDGADPFAIFTRRLAFVVLPHLVDLQWLQERAETILRRWRPHLALLRRHRRFKRI